MAVGVDEHEGGVVLVIASEQRRDVVPERRGVDAETIQRGARLFEVGLDALAAEAFDVVFGVATHGVAYFLVGINGVAREHAEEMGGFGPRHLRECGDGEEGFLSAEDVAADFFTEDGRIALR